MRYAFVTALAPFAARYADLVGEISTHIFGLDDTLEEITAKNAHYAERELLGYEAKYPGTHFR